MNGENSQPLGTYRERSPVAKREFELFADKVTIRGKNRQSQFEHHVPLEQLSPDIGSMLTRNPLSSLWALPMIFLLIALLVSLVSFRWTFNTPLSISVISLLAILLIINFVVIERTNRPKLRSYHFTNTLGVRVLDMIEAGPEKENCRAFAELVSQTIKNLRGL